MISLLISFNDRMLDMGSGDEQKKMLERRYDLKRQDLRGLRSQVYDFDGELDDIKVKLLEEPLVNNVMQLVFKRVM